MFQVPKKYKDWNWVRTYPNFALYEKEVNGYYFRECFLFCELVPPEDFKKKYIGNRTAYYTRKLK